MSEEQKGISIQVRLVKPIDTSIVVTTYGLSFKIRGIPNEVMQTELAEDVGKALPQIVKKHGGQLTIEGEPLPKPTGEGLEPADVKPLKKVRAKK